MSVSLPLGLSFAIGDLAPRGEKWRASIGDPALDGLRGAIAFVIVPESGVKKE
ncbi:MAG: hypothetical protein O7J95_04410 [Planctomycetota bacterium]|nr:hypothetical protein [Planctomycetota bacterium]